MGHESIDRHTLRTLPGPHVTPRDGRLVPRVVRAVGDDA